MKKTIKHLKFIIVFSSCIFLLGLLFINNLWLIAPDFYQLSIVFSVPLVVQLALALLCFSICTMFLKTKKTILLALYIAVFLATTLSGYMINFSNVSNTLDVSYFPFYKKTISFDELKSIEFKEGRVFINTANSKSRLLVGQYPLGIDVNHLRDKLLDYGVCHERAEQTCSKIIFDLP